LAVSSGGAVAREGAVAAAMLRWRQERQASSELRRTSTALALRSLRRRSRAGSAASTLPDDSASESGASSLGAVKNSAPVARRGPLPGQQWEKGVYTSVDAVLRRAARRRRHGGDDGRRMR